MKTLIVYSTKHGATEAIAKKIADVLENATLHNLNDGDVSISDYDCIVLGSRLTAGNIHKKSLQFIEKYNDELQNKRLGLYLSGLEKSGEEGFFKHNFSQAILDKAAAKAFLGGIFDPAKCGFAERKILKAVSNLDAYTSTVDEDRINSFAQELLDI